MYCVFHFLSYVPSLSNLAFLYKLSVLFGVYFNNALWASGYQAQIAMLFFRSVFICTLSDFYGGEKGIIK